MSGSRPVGVDAAEVVIAAVGPDDDTRLHAVARLHGELIPFGPLAALGADFLRVVAYRAPMRDGLLHTAVAEVGGTPVGFVAWTHDSARFHAEALRRHVLLAAGAMLVALVRDPRRLAALPRILRVLRSRVGDDEDRSGHGEVIGVGVRPEYLTPQFRRQSGHWLSHEVIAHAAGDVHERGLTRLRMFVAAENTPTLLLYQVMGATLAGVAHGGEPTMAVTFTLPLGRSGR